MLEENSDMLVESKCMIHDKFSLALASVRIVFVK